MNINIHLARSNQRMTARSMSSDNYHFVDVCLGEMGSIGVFVPTPEIAERLAAGINAAWPEPVVADAEGDACRCPEHRIAAE